MLTLDGAQGEGGGQILRTGLALSMVTGRPLRIERIRAGRAKPGLMRQHLACVQAALEVSGGEAEGRSWARSRCSSRPARCVRATTPSASPAPAAASWCFRPCFPH